MAAPSFNLVSGPPKGAPPPRPRQWQSQLIQLLRRRLERQDPGGQDVLIHAGPGAGKTLGALLGYQALAADGRLHDCDFNQMLELPLAAGAPQAPRTIAEVVPESLPGLPIAWGNHCFGCAAGQGSSCAGATV